MTTRELPDILRPCGPASPASGPALYYNCPGTAVVERKSKKIINFPTSGSRVEMLVEGVFLVSGVVKTVFSLIKKK
jgi:hypothetical protein